MKGLLPGAIAACTLLVSASALADGPDKAACASAFEQGQRSRRQGALLDARDNLQICARAPCPEALQPECTQRLAEVEHAMPSIVVVVRRDDATDVRDARVTVDGKLVAERLDGRPLDLDPGPHTVAVEADGASRSESILVVEGEKSRTISFRLPALKKSPPPPPQPAPQVATRPITWPTVALGAVSIVAAGFFTGFAVRGEGTYADLERCRPACEPARVDSARRSYLIADVSLVVSVLALGGAVVTFLTRPTVYRPAEARP